MLRNTYQQSPARMRSRALRRALGDVTCDQDGNCYDDSTGTYTPAAPSDISLADLQGSTTQGDCAFGLDTNGNCLPFVQTTTFPSQSAPSTPATSQSVATTIAGDLTSLLAPITRAIGAGATAAVQRPYYITNPQTGQQVLYNPATGSTSGVFGSLGTVSPTVLLIGAAVLGFLFIGGKK